MELVGDTDAHWRGDLDNGKSTMGYIISNFKEMEQQ